ncbi:MAG: transposase [Chitinivibrionales bacterium]|nr:transposase [Chitinivibrionales bacterium]
MARANRHHVPGYIWHITHRCHKKEFLLKFDKDKRRWRRWLFEAKTRYRLCVLNYVIMSNHVHLIALEKRRETIAGSMQLIEGRTAQEFNERRNRSGAFWNDRYHGTVVDTNEYLLRCLMYIDLNPRRAGICRHPTEYEFCGLQELMNPPLRYGIINRKALMKCCGYREWERFWADYTKRLAEAVESCDNPTDSRNRRDPRWTESIAVGSNKFIAGFQRRIGEQAGSRSITGDDDFTMLREPSLTIYNSAYNSLFPPEKDVLRGGNTFFWSESAL